MRRSLCLLIVIIAGTEHSKNTVRYAEYLCTATQYVSTHSIVHRLHRLTGIHAEWYVYSVTTVLSGHFNTHTHTAHAAHTANLKTFPFIYFHIFFSSFGSGSFLILVQTFFMMAFPFLRCRVCGTPKRYAPTKRYVRNILSKNEQKKKRNFIFFFNRCHRWYVIAFRLHLKKCITFWQQQQQQKNEKKKKRWTNKTWMMMMMVIKWNTNEFFISAEAHCRTRTLYK